MYDVQSIFHKCKIEIKLLLSFILFITESIEMFNAVLFIFTAGFPSGLGIVGSLFQFKLVLFILKLNTYLYILLFHHKRLKLPTKDSLLFITQYKVIFSSMTKRHFFSAT